MLPIAILSGGLATRMFPVTATIPKALIDVCGKPFVVRQLALLRKAGITDVVLCIGHLGQQIEEVLGDGTAYGIRLSYVHDGPKLLGTGGALRRALPHLGHRFFVMYGDSYLECDYGAIARVFDQQSKPALMTVLRNENAWDASNVLYVDREILIYDKQLKSPVMKHIDYGLGVLSAECLEEYPEGSAFDLASVYKSLAERKQLAAFEVRDRFYEIGSQSGLDELRDHLCKDMDHP